MTPIPPDLAEPLADRYRIIGELGRGGMAQVYLADDLKHGRKVAIKVMLPELSATIDRHRFLREIEIVSRLTHPHILPLYDSGAAGDRLYYVTPYIEGETLRDRIVREKQLPIEDALRLAREMASALNHAHHHGLVHRDIKPENVLLADGMALVADFGIARVVSEVAASETSDTAVRPLTFRGAIVGTPRYMAPEQAEGAEVDGRADMYALACVTYEMLAGRPPFTSATAEGVMRQHMSTEARPVTELRPSVPAGVAAALAKALSKLPADRPATVARFAEQLAVGFTGGPMSTPAGGLGAAAGIPNNLPAQRTHFIGRDRELAECARVLAGTRMLTLTGIGGCGKTRLALKLAGGMLESFPDGVWFVDLAPLKDAGHVVLTAAAALGVVEEPETPLINAVADHLADCRALILLDNCEHVLSASAELADRLIERCRGVKIVATSREGLGVEGERHLAIRSLAVPPAGTSEFQPIESSDAVQLFVDRARIADPAFELTERNAPVVAEICRRLDGIPLAIELAAARVSILSPEQIRLRLDDRFRLLTGGSKSALPRHQTLRATLQWSHDQLSEEEQRFFRVLSVFSGGWTLERATRVAGRNADEFEVMDAMAHLVGKSLVAVEKDADGNSRYRYLETVRQFAQELLGASGDAERARRAHLDEFLDLAEDAYREWTQREGYWAPVLESEHDNFRAALETARNAAPEDHLRLSGALAWFWHGRSHLMEGRDHLIEALAATDAAPPRPARARALWGAAVVIAWQGEGARAVPLMQEALQMWRELGNMREVVIALEGLGYAQWHGGEDERALDTFRECMSLQAEIGDPILLNRARVGLAQLLVAVGELEEARSLSREILVFSRSRKDLRSEHSALHYLADCALMGGDYSGSLALYRSSLSLAHALGDRVETCFETQGVAMSLAGLGRAREALRLLSAVEAEYLRLGTVIRVRFWDNLLDRFSAIARAGLDAGEIARAIAAGHSLEFEAAVAEALHAPGG